MQNNPKKGPKNPCKCANCGASLRINTHRISKGLATTLAKFRDAVIKLDRNKIHLQKEIRLTKNQYANFQKLRYFGLVAKYIDKKTKQHEAGYWLLTRRGNLFCKNKLEISKTVSTFRNKISDRGDEKTFFNEIFKDGSAPFWDKKENFSFRFADVTDIEEMNKRRSKQAKLF